MGFDPYREVQRSVLWMIVTLLPVVVIYPLVHILARPKVLGKVDRSQLCGAEVPDLQGPAELPPGAAGPRRPGC